MAGRPPDRGKDAATAGWRYVAAFALTCGVLVAALAAGLGFTAHGEPTQAWSASALHIHFWRAKQRGLSARANGSRVLLAGGSGVLYSVRADALGAALGRPVINIGLHAGLGLEYLLHDVERIVRPGDAIVLFLEYQLLVTTAPQWTLADYAIPADLDYLATLGPARTYELAKLLTPREYARKSLGRLVSARADPAPYLAMMDDHGDLIANQRSAQQPYHRESREIYRVPFDGKLDADAAALVRAFIARCRARGITVIAGFPAFLDFPEYAGGSYAAFFDSVARLYEQQDIPLLGMPSDFFLPRESFFDRNYHLHDEAAAELTARIAPRLSRALGCAADDGGAAKCVDPWPPLDFTRPGVPLGVQALSGFSIVEPWGRWTDGVQANIRFAQPLPRRFRLDLAVEHVFHPTGSLAIEVSLGGERRRVLARPGERLNVEFDNPSRLREIGLRLPDGGSPRSLGVSNDDRHLGVGLSSGRVIPID